MSGFADLVILQKNSPIIVVEVKRREIDKWFEGPVITQLNALTKQMHAKWGVLVDPQYTRIFRGDDFKAPLVKKKTLDILKLTGLPHESPGELLLVEAIERWCTKLRALPHGTYEELPADFVQDIQTTDDAVREYAFA